VWKGGKAGDKSVEGGEKSEAGQGGFELVAKATARLMSLKRRGNAGVQGTYADPMAVTPANGFRRARVAGVQ